MIDPTMASGSRRSLTRLVTAGAVGVCLVGGCTATRGTDIAPDSALTVTVSAATEVPMTVWVDSRLRSRSGMAGDGLAPTPVELSPERPAVVLPVPSEHDYWMWVRVAGPPDRPDGIVVACELRAADGRVLSADATDPLGPPTDEAACAGSP